MSTKFGEFTAIVQDIVVHVTSTPTIFTRLLLEDGKEQIPHTHVVRFHAKDGTPSPVAARIGLDELRGAFPTELASLNDQDTLAYLMQNTDAFLNRKVKVGIEQQKKNGIPQKSDKGIPYFNVRLRSAVRNLSATDAKGMAAQMLKSLTLNSAQAFAPKVAKSA